MTRLVTEWIGEPENDLEKYNAKLIKTTGMDISRLAFRAAGIPEMSKGAMGSHKVAVIRVTAGEGVIGSFAESVAAVLLHMGAEVFIPSACDVAGMYEAASKGADILFMADDNRFVALNTRSGAIAENDYATACGYVAALSAMAGGLAGREVLLLGFGRLGKRALKCLLAEGAVVSLYDCNTEQTTSLRDGRVKLLPQMPLPLSGLVIDATNTGGYLTVHDLTDGVMIAAPGVPLSLDDEAYAIHQGSVVHDPLHTGVAVMLALALKNKLAEI
ncbi:MAG: 3-methylornithyl-N6-L-lysine dehydrogenase PylD [Clostridiales bacterium]|nr:3-methylornithyl-N6-L-lysine dehydrogenase PylD [Clostridiales bacterium]